jgi:hypothetical protein
MSLHRIACITLLLLASFMVTGCRHEAARTASLDSSTIRIGRGGGFTGYYSGYRIDGDGSVYAWQQNGRGDSLRLLFTAGRDSTHALFRRLTGIGFDTLEFNHPGNLTYFIELHRPDSMHSVRWGDPNVSAPDSLTELYRAMQSFAESTR